jgi:hypothetical protein
MSRQPLYRAGQFGAQDRKGGAIGGPLGAYDEIDGRKYPQHIAPQNFTQSPAQAIATCGGGLMARHDQSQPRMTRGTLTPDQIEMPRVPARACFPAGRELRAARDAHAARKPLARLPTPVFGWNADDELLAALLAPPRQRGAAPNGFHPRAKSMFIDAPPIARPICRSHSFLE